MQYSGPVDPTLVARVRRMWRCCGPTQASRYCGASPTLIEKVVGSGLARADAIPRLLAGVQAWEAKQPCPPPARSARPSTRARKAAA
jgi:hypothetical protein